MQFDKQHVLSMISDPAQAEQAAQQLPDTVDHEAHAGLLQQFGVDPGQLAGSSGGQAPGAGQPGQSFQGSDPGQQGGGTDQPGQSFQGSDPGQQGMGDQTDMGNAEQGGSGAY